MSAVPSAEGGEPMHPILRSTLAQFARRLAFAAIAIGAAVGFVVVAGGSGAQTGQHEPVVPITFSAAPPPAVPSSLPSQDAVESSAPKSPPAVGLTTVRRVVVSTAPVLPATATPTATPAVLISSSSPSTTTRQRGSRNSGSPSGTSSAPTVFHYVGTRDIAAIVNPQREAQGWSDVANVAAKNSADCVATSTCSGSVAACGTAPDGIGTAATTHVADGQYRDQYGNCRELITF